LSQGREIELLIIWGKKIKLSVKKKRGIFRGRGLGTGRVANNNHGGSDRDSDALCVTIPGGLAAAKIIRECQETQRNQRRATYLRPLGPSFTRPQDPGKMKIKIRRLDKMAKFRRAVRRARDKNGQGEICQRLGGVQGKMVERGNPRSLGPEPTPNKKRGLTVKKEIKKKKTILKRGVVYCDGCEGDTEKKVKLSPPEEPSYEKKGIGEGKGRHSTYGQYGKNEAQRNVHGKNMGCVTRRNMKKDFGHNDWGENLRGGRQPPSNKVVPH